MAIHHGTPKEVINGAKNNASITQVNNDGAIVIICDIPPNGFVSAAITPSVSLDIVCSLNLEYSDPWRCTSKIPDVLSIPHTEPNTIRNVAIAKLLIILYSRFRTCSYVEQNG